MKKFNEDRINESKRMAIAIHKNDTCFLTGETKMLHIEAVVNEIKKLILADDDLIIAGYLHDVLDYSNDPASKVLSSIQNKFGMRIANIILETSDGFKMSDISTPQARSLFDKKLATIVTPSGISDEAAIVTLAERVANLTSLYNQINKEGKKIFWNEFQDRTKMKEKDVRNYYESLYDVLSNRCIGNYRLRPLINQYDLYIEKIFY